MPLQNDKERTLWVFYMAHKFTYDYRIRWLPVNPEDIIDKNPKWRMKYVPQLAYWAVGTAYFRPCYAKPGWAFDI